MHRTETRYGITALIFLLFASATALGAQKPPIDWVNALMGTAPLDQQVLIGNAPPPGEELYTGKISPGAVLPHGITDFGPFNSNPAFAGALGQYNYLHRTMYGFTTGMPDMVVLPVVGPWTVPPARAKSGYDKLTEHATPGYYSVYLGDFHVKAEMTVTDWMGMFRFTFPKSKQSHIVMDLGVQDSSIEIIGDNTVRGCGERPIPGGVAGTQWPGSAPECFVAVFSKPFRGSGTFKMNPPPPAEGYKPIGRKTVTPNGRSESGNYAGAYLDFDTSEGEQVLVKVAAAESDASARKRLETDSPGWNFDGIHQRARAAWSKLLDKIEIEGGTPHERMMFYSNFFHSFASPHLVASAGQPFRDLDGKMKTADYDRYGPVPFWDTGRDQIVLLALTEPKVMANILQSTLDEARETGFMQTSFHGDHAVWMYLGDWLRGIPFDYAAAYKYLYKNATVTDHGARPYLGEYLKKGYISDIVPDFNPSPPYAGGKAGAATTLEYAWDDAAMAAYAKKLGKEDDSRMFRKRAYNYRNVFDSADGFMRGRTSDGKWISPFDPGEPYYTFMMKEASGWSTLWLVPQDVQGLINLLGGRDKFNAKLDEFFSTPYTAKGICRDCTGMIGEYVQGNQPDQQSAYFYDWSGQPWKTQKVVREILTKLYGSDKYGLGFPGMDDQGSTSSWYVLSAMGFFPVDPATANYEIGSPLFSKATLHLGNGKDLVIEAKHNSGKNMYIQSATLNGKPLNRPWFTHAEIANGAKLVFEMGPEPNKSWGAAPDAAPPSMSKPSE
ncbi:MAG TPA: GH92 family glycosyl hydrolase [Terriglobia bacterium]|nr:GH92 family glycosyl hydrolase [Terriglobia bacterium]